MSKKDNKNRPRMRDGVWLFLIPMFATALFMMIAGSIIADKAGNSAVCGVTAAALVAAVYLIPLAELPATAADRKLMNSGSYKQISDFLTGQKESVEQGLDSEYATVRRFRVWLLIKSAVFILFPAAAMLLSVVGGGAFPVVAFFALYPLFEGFVHLPYKLPRSLSFAGVDVEKEDFCPILYRMAREAAARSGCSKPVKITVLSDDNVGISEREDGLLLNVGLYLLSVLGREETEAIFLHEFAHITGPRNRKSHREFTFFYRYRYMANGAGYDLLYRKINEVCFFRLYLFDLFNSVLNESEADAKAAELGQGEALASALIKTAMSGYYKWEKAGVGFEPFFAHETFPEDYVEKECERFSAAVKERKDDWLAYISREIRSQGAEYPTTRERLEAIGIRELREKDYPEDPGFEEEKRRIIAETGRIKAGQFNNDPEYAEMRKSCFLDREERIAAWEASGRPIDPTGYYGTLDDLIDLGRVEDAFSFASRIVGELDDSRANYARFIKGKILLGRMDAAGIPLIYRALEENDNFVRDGLFMIGEFCCLTGNAGELERLREKRVGLIQRNIDVASEFSKLDKKDRLLPENLPGNNLGEDLDFILAAGGKNLHSVYLVKKQVTEEESTSVFILRFWDDTDEETEAGIMQKVFVYLDSSRDWQYSLFDYESVADVMPLVEKIPGAKVYSPAGVTEGVTLTHNNY
ncbi:MAG: M48 family metalloprotease [Clostridia bacterium]|nr:M48 family metalloprotease [Clostridia bacterium]